MNSEGNKVEEFAQIHLITQAKFESDPKQNYICSKTESAVVYTAVGR